MIEDLKNLFSKVAEEAVRERGHANVLIAGRTGVGKSTLINSVFQGDYATVGHGRPVTQNTREITREGIPLTIFDTRGLELDNFDETRDALRKFIDQRRKDRDQNKHIHVAWVCIMEDLRRVETAETQLVKSLAEIVPVVGVITKARADRGFRAEVQKLLPDATNVIRVRAIREEDDTGHVLEIMGLEDLVHHTLELFPDGQRRAFVAAQKVDLELKQSRARTIVVSFAATAAGVSFSPIPMSETVGIAGIYIAMFAGISATYGLNLTSGFIATIVAAAVGTPTAALTGPIIVGSLLKFVPGAGTLAGGAINGAVAATLATSIGFAYIEVLHRLFAKNAGSPPDPDEVVQAVRERFIRNS